jgi:hypothetical protein
MTHKEKGPLSNDPMQKLRASKGAKLLALVLILAFGLWVASAYLF